ncbi:putative F-box domain, FBD domain, leucine-rich repeat domain superfamily [Helianthus annuus]|nr:putative F-box domain, FBD domain, leucine-rich repeat domain superfamily [Helianthus annuus]
MSSRLNRLPEVILLHILSLMPTKSAVQTSILSKSWRYRWTLVTNLDFYYNGRHPSDERSFIKFVARVLNSCKTSQVKLFRLHLLCPKVRSLCVSKLIDKAVRLNVHELDIVSPKLDFPLSMFTCKTLTKLRITHKFNHYYNWVCPSSVYLPCLKTIDIARYSSSIINVFKLIHGCPVLESLSLEIAKHNNEGDYIFNIPTLKRLKLIFRSRTNYVINKVVLRVPNLEYLFVGGVLHSLFVMEDLSSLVGASIACYKGMVSDMWFELLNEIRGVQNLSIQDVQFTSVLPIFPNMKHLELKGFLQYGLIPQYLKSCPELKSLCIDEVVGRFFKKPKQSSWIEPKLVPACMLANLTTIKCSVSRGWKCDIKFLEYVLGNAEVLKTVTITGENLCLEEEKRLCAKLLELPRVSRHCKIHFRSLKK